MHEMGSEVQPHFSHSCVTYVSKKNCSRKIAAGKGGVEKVNKHPNRSTKNKIRGVERLLKKEDLPASQRKIQEAMLSSLHKEMEAHQQSEKERKYATMYKKVCVRDDTRYSKNE